jgi:hypothetical protein
MSKVNKVKTLAAAFTVLFLMNSCTDFFSTSWGDIFKRDPNKVKVTESNVDALLDVAKGDPELALAILNQINARSSDKLKQAAIKAANQASGIPTLALENVKALIEAADKQDEKALEDLAKTIKGDLNDDMDHIAKKLTEILTVETPSRSSSDALKSAGSVTVPVSKAGSSSSSNTDTIIIAVNPAGTGTATIVVDSVPTTYNCEIKDDDTIILTASGGEMTEIGYVINDDRSLTLSDLEKIPSLGLTDSSEPSEKYSIPSGEPKIEGNFIDSVSESDLTLLVMTLILAKIDKVEKEGGTLEGYLEEDWLTKDVKTGKNLDDDELLIAAIVNEMVGRGDDMGELTDMVKKLLGVKD